MTAVQQSAGLDADAHDVEVIERFFADGGTFAILRGVCATQLETLYAQAFNFYQAGRLEDALTMFKGLAALDHYDARAFLGVAATYQALGRYQDALPAYAYGAMLAPRDPRFSFHAAQCHQHLGDLKSARSGYEQAQRLAMDSEHAGLADQAQVLLEALQQKEGAGHAS
ncbi:SycD/LcrH family type III secretion system chaperone [Pseudomonas mosselii]|jgi:type III secretion system low calcium response chaperone LcrH/SycD|uniref:SycD/LcrH family type III secretion system chaperone n=1 Tax=Pseudomonas mosselii TaxID=78327 RepID=A0AA42UQ96_9PSED|nr:SycD/LcrH family type III secretion system chaperone [Pseudomonas mosselii]MDH1631091.1 SycD/LcrH family type III secretion system chaperone [Pseudomonas mosselii]